VNPPLRTSSDMGETSLLKLFIGASFSDRIVLCADDRPPGVPEYCSAGGVSTSGEKALSVAAPGGSEGRAFSTVVDVDEAPGPFDPPVTDRVPFAFFLRLAIKLS
jgi:hypothetical protein